MVRAVRDERYKYLRHYRPDLPYLSWIPYRNRHPIVQEMWRLYAAGELRGPQLLMFEPRPVEELYDTLEDPHEIKNLAGNPAQAEVLQRLRRALDGWLHEVGDMGQISESEMVARWYPGGRQPQTASPIFIPICQDNPGTQAVSEGGTFCEPVLLQLHCATQGASLAYTLAEGDKAAWKLYSQPIRLPPGVTRVQARAIRIGYGESEERSAVLTIGTVAEQQA